ncbi:uncharacterized protein [Prorops nasuta]|uniref:uncharacterized protein isoform X2 n=1 Tax=Prorops nasuta TaxID=863751 RepID=UPI0034CF4051
MYFWINKPADRYYGFNGRRYPATPVPKLRCSQYRHGREFSQMVTPVHRFQNINRAGSVAGPSNLNSCRFLRPSLRVLNDNRDSSPVNFIQHSQLSNAPNNVTNIGNNQQILSNSSTNGTNRSLLDFSEFTDAELAGYRLRSGVWITFVLATGFVAAAKFYFGHQGPGLEILVFCGLVTLLLIACTYTILCRRTHNIRQRERRIQEDHSSLTNTLTNESITHANIARQNSPPPYHIAILIPPLSMTEEAPPPSYDKVMR